MRTVYQVASIHWPWMESEKALFMNSIKGMLVSICFACTVVFLATGNWIVTLYAIHAVGFICACQLALLKLKGAEMGISESVGILLTIGYSVDYVVRLAVVYIQSHQISRFDRTTEAITKMGVSLFNGAMATVGSTCALFFSQLIFFRKFAFMLSSTVVLSVLFSLIYYSALSHSFGPENQSGSIKKHTKLCIHDIKSQDSASGSSGRKSDKRSSNRS